MYSSSVITILPSPWEIATEWISPSFILANQGELFVIIFVCTIFDICLSIVLNVNVGESSFNSRISP